MEERELTVVLVADVSGSGDFGTENQLKRELITAGWGLADSLDPASLAAARLRDLPEEAVGLAGQGLRDVTRIAASDPGLWTQILAANPRAVRDELKAFSGDLEAVIGALGQLGDGDDAPGARGILATTIANGNAGHARIPGKHGAAPTQYGVVRVLIPDEPGQLGRLFRDVGDAGINLEELNLEHNLGQPFGQLELSVVPAVAGELTEVLRARGWSVHD